MVEEQVEEVVGIANRELHLIAHEGEAGSQFEQELSDMSKEGALGNPLVHLATESQEVEGVRILERLLCELRLWRRQSAPEVRSGLALP
jgi:hypothetical protein